MKDKKTILLDLLDMIEALELSREDYVEFSHLLMRRLGLSLTDCFPAEETAVLLQNLKNKCNELLQLTEQVSIMTVSEKKTALSEVLGDEGELIPIEDESGIIGYVDTADKKKETPKPDDALIFRVEEIKNRKVVETDNNPSESDPTKGNKTDGTAQNPLIPPCLKGYSRNGRKLGRPRKIKPVEEAKDDEKGKIEPPGDNDFGDLSEEKTDHSLTVSRDDSTVLSSCEPEKPLEDDSKDFSEDELDEIEKLKMGKVYSLNILYRWKKRFVVSNRVMQDATPVGVFVPYTRKTVGYEKFILAATDEIAGLALSKAEKYAHNKLMPYEGERWAVLSLWQIEAAKQAQPELNQILKKIGGDPFAGSYLVPKVANYHGMPDKIRYAVNVGRL